MKATISRAEGEAQSKIVLELTVEEARALEHQLGTDSSGSMLERGLSWHEADLCYTVFDKLADVVAASFALECL